MRPVCPLPSTATDPAFFSALCPELITDLVRDQLGSGSQKISIVPDYVRWKNRDGSIVGWRASVGEEATQTYITVRTAPLARLADEAAKLEHREEDYDGLKSFALVPEHGLLLINFPLDRQMSDLRRMVRASKVRTIVQENQPNLVPEGMRFSKSKSTWQLVRYKPERRAVIRWDLGFKNDNKESLRTTTWMRMVAEPMPSRGALVQAAANTGIRVPELLASPHDCLILETHLQGKPWLQQNREVIPAIAETLARLHDAKAPLSARLHTVAAELEMVSRAADDIVRLDATLAHQASAITVELERAAPADSAPRVLHGDFHCGQVLLGHDIAICDFDRSCVGSVGSDLAALYAHAVVADPIGGKAFAAEFFAAYRRHETALTARELTWWNVCALLRMVTTPFRSLRADWPNECRKILAAAARDIAEVSA